MQAKLELGQMKKMLWLIAALLITGCSKNSETFVQTMEETMYITIGEETHTVTMEDNVGTRALVAALQTDNITYVAHDYGNFEKVGYVGQSFPTADHQTTTSAGDLVLYNGDNICIFYGSNSWSYTRIGKLATYRLTKCVGLSKQAKARLPSRFPCSLSIRESKNFRPTKTTREQPTRLLDKLPPKAIKAL